MIEPFSFSAVYLFVTRFLLQDAEVVWTSKKTLNLTGNEFGAVHWTSNNWPAQRSLLLTTYVNIIKSLVMHTVGSGFFCRPSCHLFRSRQCAAHCVGATVFLYRCVSSPVGSVRIFASAVTLCPSDVRNLELCAVNYCRSTRCASRYVSPAF